MTCRRGFLLLLAAGALASALAGAARPSPEQARWQLRDLGTLGVDSRALAVNGRGQVVGSSSLRRPLFPRHAFLWQNGTMRDLGTVGRDLGGDLPNVSEAIGINDAGQVVGNSSVEQNSPVSHAFLWERGRMTSLVPRTDSWAAAISGRGDIVGWHGEDVGYGRGRAFVWRNGTLRSLGPLPGRSYSAASAVNERGHVVGESYSVDDAQDGAQVKTRAVLWRAGRMTDLGVLPGHRESAAIAIDESGRVLGSSWRSALDPVGRAFLWRQGTLVDLGAFRPVSLNDRAQVIGSTAAFGMSGRAVLWQAGKRILLPTLGGKVSEAAAINARGQVVGTSTTRTGARHAVLWENGRVVDLGTLGGKESLANAIGDGGRIVGAAMTKDGAWHAVLWTRSG